MMGDNDCREHSLKNSEMDWGSFETINNRGGVLHI